MITIKYDQNADIKNFFADLKPTPAGPGQSHAG